jgi:hypothetical protein
MIIFVFLLAYGWLAATLSGAAGMRVRCCYCQC